MDRKQQFADWLHEFAVDDMYGYFGKLYTCKNAIYKAAKRAKYDVVYERDLPEDFESAGFQLLPYANIAANDLQIGDILLTVLFQPDVYIGDGMIVRDGLMEKDISLCETEWEYVLRPPEDEAKGDKMTYPYSGTTNSGGWQGRMPTGSYNWAGGYPQGGIGQLNGYSQINSGGYQQNNVNPSFLIRVHGMDGAKAWPISPGATVPLFDDSEDIMYIKTADPQGFQSIRIFAFHELENQMQQPPMEDQPITRSDFEQLKEMLCNVQQLVSNSANTAKSRSNSNQQQSSRNAGGNS